MGTKPNAGLNMRREKCTKGFTLIELLIVVAIILIIAGIAIPSFLRSRMVANESSAATSVRTITTAATVYNITWNNGYPPDLPTMGGTGLVATCTRAILLDQLMTTPPFLKSGYNFTYAGVGPNTPPVAGCAPGFYQYLATATPAIIGSTGQRSFCSDTPGVIHFDITGAAIASVGACDALPAMH
jgi:type IV pilus assembly protein PilA